MPLDYVGGELELFSCATNWKAYVARQLSPFIRGRVLEVGAGIGSNIVGLMNPHVTDWLALEPDPQHAAEIASGMRNGTLPSTCRVLAGTVDDVPPQERFDAILYIDVLEHIEDDRSEAAKAAGLLAPEGHVMVTRSRPPVPLQPIRPGDRPFPPLRPGRTEAADAGRLSSHQRLHVG